MPEWDEADIDSSGNTDVADDFAEIDEAEQERGYLRHKDYTQKRQADAATLKQAESALALQNALETDFQGTVAYLAQQYGFSTSADDEDELPFQREINDLRNRVEEQERVRRAEKLEASCIKAIATHGLTIEADELVRHMLKIDTGSPETAARDLAYDKKGQASTDRIEKVTAAKRNLPNATGSRSVGQDIPAKRTFRESAELAAKGIRAPSNTR
jgi:hypothetical protein